MYVYIPLANCQTVDEEVRNLLQKSPLIDGVWEHPTKEFYPKWDCKRYKAIADNNRDIFELAIKVNDKFFVLCNSNAKMLKYIPHLEFCHEYITSHDNCGFVSYSPMKTKRSPHHVCIGFGIVRTEAAKVVKFDITNKPCNCRCLAIDMRQKGWEVSYVSKDIRIKKRSV